MTNSKTIRVTDLAVDRRYNDIIVDVYGRDKDGNRIVRKVEGTEPYFFVPARENPLVETGYEEIKRIEEYAYEGYDGEDLTKIVVHKPKHVASLRDSEALEDVETYEDDLPYDRRCTADYNLSGYLRVPSGKGMIDIDEVESIEEPDTPISPRKMVIDIEVKAPKGGFYEAFPEEAPQPVTSITAWDSYEDKYSVFVLDPDESVNAGEIRDQLEEHWSKGDLNDEIEVENYTDCAIGYRSYRSEELLLQDFVSYVADIQPDIVSGWNYCEFDHRYIKNRLEQFDNIDENELSPTGWVGGWKIEGWIDGIPAVDLMKSFCDFMSYGEWKSKRLDYVASEELGVGKMKDPSYTQDRTGYTAYNIIDVQLCVALDRIQGIHSFLYQLADICSIPVTGVGSTMKMVEGFFFKHRTDNEILPSTSETEVEDMTGGFVMPPTNGITDDVGVIDLKSLYPSTIMTCNISPETLTTDTEEADVIIPDMPLNHDEVATDTIEPHHLSWELGQGSCVGFTLDKEGIIPKYIKKLFDTRSEYKQKRDNHSDGSTKYEVFDAKQYAIKVLMNSVFGTMSNSYFRLSVPGLGDAITGASRYINWTGTRIIREKTNARSIYSDTDSAFLVLEGDNLEEQVHYLKDVCQEVNDVIAEEVKEMGLTGQHPFYSEFHGPSEHCWLFEPEKVYERFIQVGTKKRYAGKIVWKEGQYVDKIDITGFESVRGNTADITGTIQPKVIELILEDADFRELSDYLRQEVEKVRNMEYDVEDIGFPSHINQPLSEYNNLPKVRAVKFSNQHLGYAWGEGDKPWVVYVDKTPIGIGATDCIALEWSREELPEGYVLDADKHIEKSIEKPIEDIIEHTEWTLTDLLSGHEPKSIGEGW